MGFPKATPSSFGAPSFLPDRLNLIMWSSEQGKLV